MTGSIFGNSFSVTTWGESHGPAIGAVIDGCPAGLPLTEDNIQAFLNRRKPGQSKYTTSRKEDDQVEILSGVFKGCTTGTAISLIVRNTDQRSQDYGQIQDFFRPGHADYTFHEKYGFRDYRGGGRTSGRETIGRVAAGAVASLLLEELGIHLTSYTKSIGSITVPEDGYHFNEISENPLYMPSNAYAEDAAHYLEDCIKNQDSSGGIIECIIDGMPTGIGEPVFRKLDACLAQAVMSIGQIVKRSNHAGGVLGGLSDGSRIILRAAIKPTPSIAKEQETIDIYGNTTNITVTGRHDPVIVPRAVVVVESMAAITIADLLIDNMSSKVEHLQKIYLKNL